jgi:hypothetical protein
MKFSFSGFSNFQFSRFLVILKDWCYRAKTLSNIEAVFLLHTRTILTQMAGLVTSVADPELEASRILIHQY